MVRVNNQDSATTQTLGKQMLRIALLGCGRIGEMHAANISAHPGAELAAVFDVFTPDGRFAHQVSISGEGNYTDDGVHFVGDRLYVVKGLRSAREAMFGGNDEEASEEDLEDAEPMSVICYELGSAIVQGRN